ncbi:flagellar hook-length control protein [Marinobacter santoriniensis NKSG1]|uniref:Flagellar hook-length control protein n=2 Tax=Marinobacter santoriniensis TaxID=523742 RepID=M7CQE2_9GAMM|nr:flagellar hook-length control protein [Marinobacter santoriniensis NKSG1]
MVLPQALGTDQAQDTSPAKAGSARKSDGGESRFDSVSRAEQRRMDSKHSESRETSNTSETDERARDDQDSAVDGNAESRPPEKTDGKDRETTSGDTEETRTVGTSSKKGETDTTNVDQPDAPITFADLQALLTSSGKKMVDAGKSGTGQATAGVGQTFSALVAPGMSADGNAGNLTPGALLKGSAGSAGMSLADLVGSAFKAEKSGASDSGNLASGLRFQGVMDVAAQQSQHSQASQGNNGVRVPAEAAVPLRSYSTSVDVPVGHSEWGDKVVGKLSWLTARNMSVAEIHLTPPDMGPMEVKVRVHHDQATITVHSANPVVRDQLEMNSHRLRDMLSDQGLSLAQFDVSDQAGQQAGGEASTDGDREGSASPGGGLLDGEAVDPEQSIGTLDLSWKGEVDIFA